MATANSVTFWIGQLKTGDAAAAQQVWERYFERLVRLARKKLRGRRPRLADEEDVALGAFDSFYRGIQKGRFPKLDDRGDLWQLLVMIAERKAIDLVNHEGRLKRGGGKVVGEGELPAAGSAVNVGLDRFAGREPTPEFAVRVAEDFQRLLDRLEDADLQCLALWKMEGYTTAEIARKLDCARRTVERRLRLIRTIWEQEAPQ
jgi:RNA polymerase sigma factor (sigma-70 family)